jgi:hypothetical protein
MSTNLERFKKDLDRLIAQGHLLDMAIVKESAEESFMKQVKAAMPAEKIKDFLKTIPDFKSTYEAWYSESLALIRQLLPDRVGNFISMYEKPKSRKDILYSNYVIQDYMQGLTVGTHVRPVAAVPQYRQQLSMLKAAIVRFNSSLFEIKQLVQADLFDSEIEVARELQKHKFFRAAGAIAGVILEKHLQQVCEDWPAPGSEDTELGVLMELEVRHGETEVYP